MNRKTLLAGAIFAGLILVTIGLLRSPEKGSRPTGERPRPVPKLKAGDFDTLAVTKNGATTVIKKQGDSYQVVKPVEYPGDKDTGKQAFDSVEKLEFGTVISAQKSRYDELEVGDSGLRVAVKKGDKVLADLHVGKMTNEQVFVRLEGKDEVWGATGLSRYYLDKDATAWRDKHIVTFPEIEAEKIEIDNKAHGRLVLFRPAPKDAGPPPEWRVYESSIKVAPFDKYVVSDVLLAFSTWQTNEFADNAKLADTGLDSPESTITATLHNGKQWKVLIGKKKGEEDTYVKLADKPQIFLVKKYSIDRVNKRPLEFRDKTLCDLTADEVTEVAVMRDKDPFVLSRIPGKTGDEAWKLTKPAGVTPDPSKVTTMVGAFSNWKGQSFAEDNSPKTTGMAKPSATISAKSSIKGHACTLKVGSETSDKNNYYVQANGQPETIVAAKWSVDRLLVKMDDLKKK